MVKKLGLIFLLAVLAGMFKYRKSVKNTENAVFSLDKSSSGKMVVLYPDRQKIKTAGTLVEGKLQGKYTEYYENGNLLLVTHIKRKTERVSKKILF